MQFSTWLAPDGVEWHYLGVGDLNRIMAENYPWLVDEPGKLNDGGGCVSSGKTFLELCVEGVEQPSNIDDYVDMWHDGDDPREIYEFLGLSWSEYGEWVRDSSAIYGIVEAHKRNDA